MAGRFAAEAIGSDVEEQAALGQRAACRGNRVDRITGCRREHEIGRREGRRPVAAGIEPADGRVDLAFGTMQAADAAEQIGEALQIAGFLKLSTVHDRRKAHDFRAGFAMTADQGREPLDHILVERGACVDAIGAHLVKQRVGKMIQRIGRLRRDPGRIGLGSNVHDQASMVRGVAVNRARLAVRRSSGLRLRYWRGCGRC